MSVVLLIDDSSAFCLIWAAQREQASLLFGSALCKITGPFKQTFQQAPTSTEGKQRRDEQERGAALTLQFLHLSFL